jgi:hypothetical protein
LRGAQKIAIRRTVTTVTHPAERRDVACRFMEPRRKREPSDDEPTAEHQTLKNGDEEIDPATTDQLGDQYRVSLDYTGEYASGTVDHDDRGQARWKWNTESTPAGEIDRTFDLLKALNNDALSIEITVEEKRAKPPLTSGYDPYDIGDQDSKQKKPRKK